VPAVEEIGIQPVPRALRTGTWRDLSLITFAFGINPVYYVLGAIAVVEFRLPLWWAVALAVLAQAISYGILVAVSRVGTEHGIAGLVSFRAFLGMWGARGISSPYRLIAALYWFATQAITASFALRALFDALWGFELPIVPVAVGLAAVQAVLAVAGFDILRYATRIVLPLAAGFVVVMLVLYVTSDDPRYEVGRVFDSPDQTLTWAGAAGYLTLMIGSQLTFLPSAADFTRYTRSTRDVQIGMLGSAIVTMVVTTFVGGYAGAAAGSTKSPFEALPSLTASDVLLVFGVLVLVVQSLVVNIGNAYNLGLALANAVPRLGRVGATAVAAAMGVALAGVPDFLTSASDWITHLGSVAAPLAGVVLADYLVIKRRQIDVDALFTASGPYRYVGGVNVAALVAIAFGVVVYVLVPDELLKVAWGGGVSFVAYLALRPLQARRLSGAAPASRG
jgi:NCS1 family nucleobase:cation symporter-1